MQYEWPGKLIYNPETQTITWRREQMKHKKEEMKKPMKTMKEKKEMKKDKKKDCM